MPSRELLISFEQLESIVTIKQSGERVEVCSTAKLTVKLIPAKGRRHPADHAVGKPFGIVRCLDRAPQSFDIPDDYALPICKD